MEYREQSLRLKDGLWGLEVSEKPVGRSVGHGGLRVEPGD